MRAVSRQHFLETLEHQASKRGFGTDIHEAEHASNFSVALVSEDAVQRMTFVLATKQEISRITYKSMLRRIDSFLSRPDLSPKQRRFGQDVRLLVVELLESAEIDFGGSDVARTRSEDIASAELGGVEPLPTTGTQAQRDWYIANVDCLTQDGLRRIAAAPLSQSRLLAIDHGGETYFPRFQFVQGKPLPIVGAILEIFEGKRSGWQTAFWFISANGWMDGRTPAQHLDDPDAVAAAAYREVRAPIA